VYNCLLRGSDNDIFLQGPRYEFNSGGATLYTNFADFESTRGATMVGVEGPENYVADWSICIM